MKPKLKPTSRINNRYLLVEAQNKEVIIRAILEYSGVLGYAQSAPTFVNLKTKSSVASKNEFILAINRNALTLVRASFEISKDEIHIKKVSGTLKGLQK